MTDMPAIETIQEVTWKNLKGKLDDDAIKKFLESTAGALRIPAEASLKFVAIFGTVECRPIEAPYSSWEYKTEVWGAGAATVDTIKGTLTTSHWDTFVQQTTGCHVQTTAIEIGGWLQINFLRELTVIGQFNGLAAGVGIVEAGGNGKWRRK